MPVGVALSKPANLKKLLIEIGYEITLPRAGGRLLYRLGKIDIAGC